MGETAARALCEPPGMAPQRTSREIIVAKVIEGAAQANYSATRLLLEILRGNVPAPPEPQKAYDYEEGGDDDPRVILARNWRGSSAGKTKPGS